MSISTNLSLSPYFFCNFSSAAGSADDRMVARTALDGWSERSLETRPNPSPLLAPCQMGGEIVSVREAVGWKRRYAQ